MRDGGWDVLGVVAAALVAATAVAYMVIQVRQDGLGPRPWVYFALLVVALGALVHASAPVGRRPVPWLAAASVILVALGFLGLFTIGLPLLVAAILVFASLGRRTNPPVTFRQ